MKLTDDEKAMLDGREGKAQQKAMELLVRYAEALGAERFVDTNERRGRAGLGERVSAELLQGQGRRRRHDAIFSLLRPRLRRARRRAAGRSCTRAISRAAPIRTTGRRSARSPRLSRITRSARHTPSTTASRS